MRIGELSRRTGASVRSLRHYEMRGLITATRGRNGYREFEDSAVERVRRIRGLIANGFTIDDILPLSPCLEAEIDERQACDDAIAIYQGKLEELDGRISELRRLRRRVASRLEAMRAEANERAGAGTTARGGRFEKEVASG